MNFYIWVGIVLSCITCDAQVPDAKYMTKDKNKHKEWVNPGWSQEETILAKAIIIRAKALQEKTGISFADLKLVISFEWALGKLPDGTEIDAMYVPEKQTIYFVYRLVSDLNMRLKGMLFKMDPEVVAKDETLGKLIDHELGHAIADVISRKVCNKPFYTVAQYNALDRNAQFGLNVVSEGIADYFSQARGESITNDGGLWLVCDILVKHKERGLAWLVSHPFVPGDNLRKSAEEYKSKALKELSE